MIVSQIATVRPTQQYVCPVRIVPNLYRSIEAWMQFHHRDIPHMDERELRRDLRAVECQSAMEGEQGGCHWWLIERLACLRAALTRTEEVRQ